MSFLIRSAELEDIPAITAIYRHNVLHGTASFELTPPNEAEMKRRFQALAGKEYPYLVAVDAQSDALLGYAYAGPYRSRPAYRYSVEDSIYIAEHAQGQGLGRALLSALIERSEMSGFRQMIAVISGEEQKASIALHQKLGFKTVGTFKSVGWKQDSWLDTLLMQRPLGLADQSVP